MKIVLDQITCINSKIKINFSFDNGLAHFFCDNKMEYDYVIGNECVDVSKVPESILVIPWICNILPIVWLTNSSLELDALDKSFFDSIDDFKQGYIEMHPDCEFLGNIVVKKLENNICNERKRSATFFSGGVDAYGTLVRHLDEKPDLLTIWGADIPYDNVDGWSVLRDSIEKNTTQLGLPLIIIHSSFRKMLNEHNLTRAFRTKLHDNWWHGAQHGIGLIGHAAPIDYVRGVTTQYIAASYWPGVNISCASWPTIDNRVKFFNCNVFHDAFIPRQEKIAAIVNSHKQNATPIDLHVCWKTTSGKNCCVCEKCCRTIMGLYAEAANPENYGFNTLGDINQQISLCKNEFDYDFVSIPMWNQIKQRAMENKKEITAAGYLNKVEWMFDFDFNNANNTLHRKIRRVKQRVLDKIENTLCCTCSSNLSQK